MKFIFTYTILTIFISSVFSQKNIDKAIFKTFDKGESYYYNSILKDINNYNLKNKTYKPHTYLAVDVNNITFPKYLKEYKTVYHNQPISQGNTGTCWCFSATSFMESEVYRITKNKVKLSEMWTVYWEYVERAEQFVETRGKTTFSEGSEANEIPIIYKKYGIVRFKDYIGKNPNQKFYNHNKLISELTTYLNSIKKDSKWNKSEVIKTVKSILNSEIGTPPDSIIVNDKKITPKDYLKNYLKLNPDEYYSFMSTMSEKFNEKSELIEDDNWRHNLYYNLTLDDYYELIFSAIKNGYSISICGDVSEPGIIGKTDVAFIPDFDCPKENINQASRELRLQNNSTTDDHCIHIIGYLQKNGETWFAIKDSGSGAFDGESKGYRYFREDYIKLKMMNILVHRDAATKYLDKIIK